jgi:hypothetical protein
MLDLIKCIEKLGSGVQLTDEDINNLSDTERALLESRNIEALKKHLNAPTKIICGILPAEDDDDKDDEDDKQNEPDKEEKSA